MVICIHLRYKKYIIISYIQEMPNRQTKTIQSKNGEWKADANGQTFDSGVGAWGLAGPQDELRQIAFRIMPVRHLYKTGETPV